MRIVSLQPSITLTLSALGRTEMLCGVTRYCLEGMPELVGMGLPVLHDSWTANTEEIASCRPHLVIASVPYRMESLAEILKAGIPVMALAPHSLSDVFADIRLIGRLTGADASAETLIAEFEMALTRARETSRGLSRPRVYCEEWGKPLIRSQAWVAELVDAAGGSFLGSPGSHTAVEEVAASDPDVLVFAWCGAGNRVPLARIVERRGWESLSAVREGRVFCVPDELLNTPAHTLLGGLRCLGAAIHPETFEDDPRLVRLPF